MQTNLDLDSFDKIKDAYTIVLQINAMKRLNKFAASIDEHVDAVNKWFIKVTNDVFSIIKNTFNAEKWKEQGYETLDFNKAEKGLYYLYTCKDIPILFQSDCMSTLNSLEEFIKYFSSFVRNEMDSNFEKIIHYQGKNKDEMFEKARMLASRLQEISEIKTKYLKVFSNFIQTTLIEEWKKKLASYLGELIDEMMTLSRTNHPDELNTKLSVAKALSKLDSFMDDKFNDVYKEYKDISFTNTTGVCKKAIEAIKDNDYDLVASEMAALQTSDQVGEHFLQQAKRAINVGLASLLDETKNRAILLSYNIEIEEIKYIVENLKRMKRAQQFIAQFLDSPGEIDECIKDVKNILAERIIRFIEGIKASITVNNFSEADKRIDSIVLVHSLLGIYCTPEVSVQIDELKTSLNNVVLTDLVNKYSDMDINKYTLHPPTDIFAKFGEVTGSKPIYNQAYNKIKEAILAKFRLELDNAKSQLPPTLNNIHIRKFESAVKYLPKDMREALEEEFKHCKEDIDQLIHDNDNRLNDACNSGDLKSIKHILEEYKNTDGMKPYFNKGRDFVLRSINDNITKIRKCFEDHDVTGALLNVKIFYEHRVNFQDIITDIRQPYLDVQNLIKNAFQEAYRCFVNSFLDSSTSTVTDDIIQKTEKSFICLIEFMKFSSENKCENKDKDKPPLMDILPEDFNEKINILNEKSVQYFVEHEKYYKEALTTLDVTSLKDILEISKQWNSLIIKMKTNYNTHYINDDSTKTVVKAIAEFTVFPQMLESITHTIEELKDELIRQELINNETKGFSKQRDEFYRKLNEQYNILGKAKIFINYNKHFDVKKAEEECLISLETKITNISSKAEVLLGKFMSDIRLDKQECDNFNVFYNNMLSFKHEMKVIRIEINQKIETIERKFFEKIGSLEAKIESGTTIDETAKILIHMKRAENNFPSFKLRIHEKVDEILGGFKNSKKDSTAFGKLGVLLNQDATGIGQSIVAEHNAFQGYSLSLFNEKTQKHGLDYVLNLISGEDLDKKKLRTRYNEFHDTYDKLVKKYLIPNMKLDQLIADAELLAGDVKQQSNSIEWDAIIRNKVPKLAAHVFALWTLQNAHHYFEADGVENKESYLLQPHAAQVISIFRMLGIGDVKEELSNNLVQIGTGEGKSVTLGATASILALLGFDVCCACYSEYLSQRDYTAFVQLFDSLGVLSYIHYGTFNKLCEYIINENGDVRQVVEQLISKDSNIAVENAKIIKRAKILLIDEVDVFFSRDFYGNIYTPAATLKDSTITSLVNCIWAWRKSKLNLNKIKEIQQYKDCCARFPKWELLIQEAIKDMLSDVNSFESHNYVVKEDKIGYIEQDNIIYNVVYGYKTLFAYYFEHDKGKISKTSLEDNICIRIKCGGFSYAETPLQFQSIMGVTGTLETLSDQEKEVIKSVYKINKTTITPSVFGANNLKFTKKDDIRIESSDDYFNVIRREIDDRLVGKSSEKCAVLVFFESEKKLKTFYESKALEPIKDSVAYLIEEASPTEKDTIIKRTTSSGQVTLFTRTFGRGTDFVCHDPAVAANGGTHVIQTFLSEEVSEEVQIKGRTARQGDYGSYSMILLYNDLERFQIDKDDVQDVRDGRPITARLLYKVTNALNMTDKYETVYDLLNSKRMAFFKAQYEDNMKYVKQAKERNESGQRFLSSLKSGDINSIRTFLIEENKGVEGTSSSRTVCLMDATGSMSHLLQKSKNTVGTMFERASKVLKENNISSDSFEIQFVVYRNYCCREDKILQHSPWETKPDNLRAFMNTINVEGGLCNEAIEIGLWHANEEHKRENITQVILIGDAPPNTNTEVDQKRNRYGEAYWQKTKFAQKTYYEKELAQLISNRIPVHAFFVENRAETTFRDIAKKTGGKSEFLDINSDAGADMLTDLVTIEILRNIGGPLRAKALINTYNTKFGKSYT
ncbi:unnamed protein product [Rotaria sp. Silwood2]|nr:unnamed protein product [Rotaria sp. Silwood2]